MNLPVWSWRDYGMLLYPAQALREGLHKQIVPFERGRVQVCSINRFLQHCARGIEPASVELAGLRHASVFCPSTARGVAHGECAPASVGVYMCVALPASHSTVRERLNLPVWCWRDCGMLCFLPEHCARGGTRRVCPCERGSVHVCSVTCFLQHCARGIAPASVELAGLWHATVSCPSTTRGVAQADCAL